MGLFHFMYSEKNGKYMIRNFYFYNIYIMAPCHKELWCFFSILSHERVDVISPQRNHFHILLLLSYEIDNAYFHLSLLNMY